MENKNVGYLLLGLSMVIIFIIFLFNNALEKIIDSNCTMEGHIGCTMYDTLNQQTYLALGITSILVIVALFLVFSKPQIKTIVKTKTIEKKRIEREYDTSDLRKEEKDVFSIVRENKTIFQADLIEKTGFGKAKISRVLDKLENRGFIERKRRGMTNVVVIKED